MNVIRLGQEDSVLASKMIELVPLLEERARQERPENNEVAKMYAGAAIGLMKCLEHLGLGPQVEALR